MIEFKRGQIGLFLGASILSIFELGEFIFEVIIKLNERRKAMKKINSIAFIGSRN
jgi:hypothetical protein